MWTRIQTVIFLAAIGLATVGHAAPRYPITAGEVIAADDAEDLLCRDQLGNSLSEPACARRDQLTHYLAKRGWCWGPDEAIEAERHWMRSGATCHTD